MRQSCARSRRSRPCNSSARPCHVRGTTPSLEPRQHRNREAELAAAIRVFCQKGYAAASIRDVANEVGVLQGGLYHYISSRRTSSRGSSTTLCSRRADHGRRVRARRRPADAAARIRRASRHLVLEHVEHATVCREWRFLTGERRRIVKARRDGYEQFIAGLIKDGQAASGSIAADLDVKYALYYVLGAVNAVPEWYRRTGRDRPARIAATTRT
ncbi:MAG: TetR/AcrR family transcriptional regulator [Solirubrobacterales bacterium]